MRHRLTLRNAKVYSPTKKVTLGSRYNILCTSGSIRNKTDVSVRWTYKTSNAYEFKKIYSIDHRTEITSKKDKTDKMQNMRPHLNNFSIIILFVNKQHFFIMLLRDMYEYVHGMKLLGHMYSFHLSSLCFRYRFRLQNFRKVVYFCQPKPYLWLRNRYD